MKRKNSNPDERSNNLTAQKIVIYILIALMMIIALVIPLGLSNDTYETLHSYSMKYQVGELAEEDVIAKESFSFVDEEATDAAVVLASRSVLPYFAYSMNRTLRNIARIDEFTALFEAYGSGQATSLDPIYEMLLREGLSDTQEVISHFASLSPSDRTKLLRLLKESLRELLSVGLYSSNELDKLLQQGYAEYSLENGIDFEALKNPQQIAVSAALTKDDLERVMLRWMTDYSELVSGFEPQLLIQALRMFAIPNVEYDELMTIQRRQAAAASVEPVVVSVKKGDLIVQQDTVINEQTLKILQHLNSNSMQYTFLEQVGRLLFVVICTFCALLVFTNYLPNTKREGQYMMLLLIISMLCQGGMYLVVKYTGALAVPTLDPFLPVLLAPVFISLVCNRKRLGMVSAFLLAMYAMLLPNSNPMTFFFILVEAGCCVYFIKFVGRRIDMVYQWFFSCLSCAFVTLMVNLLLGYAFDGIFLLLMGSIVNVSLTYVLVFVLLPLAEQFLNLPTNFRLHELAYSDTPVLTRLSQVAQGTYNHSRIVADLAYGAATAVGANALLARVGGLYHDIGKADHPEYFGENQTGDNKHDDLKPSLSAAIIKSHVKLGMEKGRDTGLPQEVLDIIGEHHGNDVIYYFYNEAKQEASQSNRDIDVNKEDFSYNSTPPTSPEAAIVMLSDCVEAATRSIKRPTTTKYQKVIHQIIMEKINHHQLDDSRLSLTDLEDIAVSFLNILIGRDHHRIEYPEEKLAQPVRGKTVPANGE